MAYIEFRNVCKIYGSGEQEIRALDNITFDVEKLLRLTVSIEEQPANINHISVTLSVLKLIPHEIFFKFVQPLKRPPIEVTL